MKANNTPYDFETCIFINSIGQITIDGKIATRSDVAIASREPLYIFWNRLIELFPYGQPTIVSDANVKASVFAEVKTPEIRRGMLEFEFSAVEDSVADVLTLVVQMGVELQKQFPSLEFHILTIQEDYFSLAIVGLDTQLIYTIRAALVARDLLLVNDILLRNHVGVTS